MLNPRHKNSSERGLLSVTSATQASSTVATRYAVALIDLAQEANALEAVDKDMANLSAMMSDSADFSSLIRSPVIAAAKQQAALSAISDKASFNRLTRNFLSLLAKNRRLGALEAIIAAFYRELSARRGEVAVKVQTAQALSDSQLKDLQGSLGKSIGKAVSIEASVNPAIMGGMIVTVGSQMIDDSVARKLQRLKTAMTQQSNENVTHMKEVG
jgi:F-type H+-transporting ATPase subunit delta